MLHRYKVLANQATCKNVNTSVHNLHTLCCKPVCTAEPVYWTQAKWDNPHEPRRPITACSQRLPTHWPTHWPTDWQRKRDVILWSAQIYRSVALENIDSCYDHTQSCPGIMPAYSQTNQCINCNVTNYTLFFVTVMHKIDASGNKLLLEWKVYHQIKAWIIIKNLTTLGNF
jgi:hypothetical protein